MTNLRSANRAARILGRYCKRDEAALPIHQTHAKRKDAGQSKSLATAKFNASAKGYR